MLSGSLTVIAFRIDRWISADLTCIHKYLIFKRFFYTPAETAVAGTNFAYVGQRFIPNPTRSKP